MTVRLMMIGPYPRTPAQIDGGVAAAMTYLSQALSRQPGLDLVGVRIASGGAGSSASGFDWPVVDMPLERLSLSTLYARQKSQLAALVRKYRPNIIHAQGTDVAGFVAVSSGLLTVVTVHGLLGECAKYQTDAVARWRAKLVAGLTERATVRRATELIAISPYVRRYYENEIRGRIHDIPNAVAPAYFATVRKPEKGRLLYAGRIAAGKGLVELLQAVAMQRGKFSQVVLAGATPDSGYGSMLRRVVVELGIGDAVRFAGLLDEPSLLEEFGRAEALALPSFQETAPMVVQQAMAAGLPIVASRVGGIPHQICHGENGLLFDAGDVAALGGLLGRLADEPGLGPRLSEQGRAHARSYWRAETVALATAGVYARALASHGQEAAIR